MYSKEDMLQFASWFQSTYGDINTNPTLADLELWEKANMNWNDDRR